MTRPTSKQRILWLLREAEGRWLSGLALAEVGGYRFGARILELRADGYAIQRRPSPRSAVHEYRLVPQDEQLSIAL